jgi:MFS family permease
MTRRPLLSLAAAWTPSSTADNVMLFVLLWIAGPQGWSGAQTALLVVAIRLLTVIGGIVGGRAVDRFGPAQMLILDSCVRAVLMAVVRGRRDRRTPARRTGVPRRAEARTGWASAPVIGLIGLSVACYFTYGPFETVLPYFTREQLSSGVMGYTLLWVLFGTAALGTLPLAPWLAERNHPRRVRAGLHSRRRRRPAAPTSRLNQPPRNPSRTITLCFEGADELLSPSVRLLQGLHAK